MRFEFIWSLIVALFILSGAVAWTTASQPLPAPAVASAAWKQAGTLDAKRDGCRRYAQYEFKVGYIIAPGCLPQADD